MKKFFALLAIALLAACESAPDSYTPDPLTFAGAPLRVNVAEIKVIENYEAPLRAPNVEQNFPVPPAVAVKEWAAQRLVAVGTTGTLEVTIDDASVREVPLPKPTGVKGFFTESQDTRYDANLKVGFKLYNGTDAMSAASGDVAVSRSHTVSEKATVDDRYRLFHSMTKDMMGTFDQQAQQRFHQYFAAYLQ